MNIAKLYARGGFVTHLVRMDMGFEEVKDKVGLPEVNITAEQQHVAKVDSQIRLMKERRRCSTSYMLDCGIKYIHKHIIIHMLYNVCPWMNEFPMK